MDSLKMDKKKSVSKKIDINPEKAKWFVKASQMEQTLKDDEVLRTVKVGETMSQSAMREAYKNKYEGKISVKKGLLAGRGQKHERQVDSEVEHAMDCHKELMKLASKSGNYEEKAKEMIKSLDDDENRPMEESEGVRENAKALYIRLLKLTSALTSIRNAQKALSRTTDLTNLEAFATQSWMAAHNEWKNVKSIYGMGDSIAEEGNFAMIDEVNGEFVLRGLDKKMSDAEMAKEFDDIAMAEEEKESLQNMKEEDLNKEFNELEGQADGEYQNRVYAVQNRRLNKFFNAEKKEDEDFEKLVNENAEQVEKAEAEENGALMMTDTNANAVIHAQQEEQKEDTRAKGINDAFEARRIMKLNSQNATLLDPQDGDSDTVAQMKKTAKGLLKQYEIYYRQLLKNKKQINANIAVQLFRTKTELSAICNAVIKEERAKGGESKASKLALQLKIEGIQVDFELHGIKIPYITASNMIKQKVRFMENMKSEDYLELAKKGEYSELF